jgi:putative colanic acid biosynthesis UDP-glucose lipid carrier transferase
LIDFADENNKTIKFIPDTKEIFQKFEDRFYEIFPVLSIQQTTLHEPVNKLFKRIFLFHIIILGLILVPILALLIKLESRGPVFFKQGRPGIDENEFFYKFRSMKINKTTEMETSKNDPRVTRIASLLGRQVLMKCRSFKCTPW